MHLFGCIHHIATKQQMLKFTFYVSFVSEKHEPFSYQLKPYFFNIDMNEPVNLTCKSFVDIF